MQVPYNRPMCRLAAYVGKPLLLKELLLEPEHSLYVQSWQPRELAYAKLNADGFGFGWYLEDGRPAAYRSPTPIWADANLESLACTLRRDLWLAMVRSATPGYANDRHNTQPFHDESLLFLHNGFVENFGRGLRRSLIEKLDADLEAAVRGLTDSEYLFALLRQMRRDHPGDGVADSLRRSVAWVERHVGDDRALLNFIVGDGAALYCVRCAFNDDAPSLYHLYDGRRALVASERLTPQDDWRATPAGSVLVVARDSDPVPTPL